MRLTDAFNAAEAHFRSNCPDDFSMQLILQKFYSEEYEYADDIAESLAHDATQPDAPAASQEEQEKFYLWYYLNEMLPAIQNKIGKATLLSKEQTLELDAASYDEGKGVIMYEVGKHKIFVSITDKGFHLELLDKEILNADLRIIELDILNHLQAENSI